MWSTLSLWFFLLVLIKKSTFPSIFLLVLILLVLILEEYFYFLKNLYMSITVKIYMSQSLFTKCNQREIEKEKLYNSIQNIIAIHCPLHQNRTFFLEIIDLPSLWFIFSTLFLTAILFFFQQPFCCYNKFKTSKYWIWKKKPPKFR